MANLSRRWMIFCAVALFTTPGVAAEQSPKEPLTAIYKAYDGKDAKGYNWNDGPDCKKAFSAATAKLILDDAEASKGEIGALDFDPIIDAQDYQITNLKIDVAETDASHATAAVSFLNFKKPTKLKMAMLKEKDGWRIDDIIWSGKDRGTLKGIFKP